ncbi:hypothetical protein T4D_9177 [Trichinella pseudospiralis]|uniref:Uncharacterized protein n=1 Tax=Trichinella pseudospiralis TaxID=6337 RepID=A0A0V1FFH9_TRIPS|nr:hypothetical protein T4D_9177 [Trichinella pseudospiralis]
MAIGKDPRTSELIPSDCLITLVRELLPDLTKIKWDEMTMDNESSHAAHYSAHFDTKIGSLAFYFGFQTTTFF